MKNNIRWLLTEARLSNIDPNKINFIDGKLICYHLTSKQKWVDNSEIVRLMDSPFSPADKEILSTDNRAQRILKKISNDKKNVRPKEWEIEEFVITDMMEDPYTDTSGFTAGGGDYHGKGLYTCYKFNPKIASSYGNICLVFEIDISNFLITFEDLAKQVHGENWRIKDQLLKLYQLEERSPESIEKYRQLLSEIPDSDLEMGTSVQDLSSRTAHISLRLLREFTKENITCFYDGIVLFGSGDGPVCVSFLPKYDAKLIGLGRVNKVNPEIVDWYDSLDDFLGGRAKLKQDFEALNDIALEITDPDEKEEMKSKDRLTFDMEYIEISKFFRSYYNAADKKASAVNELFDLYSKTKSSGDQKKIEFFLKTFKMSKYSTDVEVIKHPSFSEISDEVIKFYNSKAWDMSIYYYSGILNVCSQYNIKVSEFFLENAINECLNEKIFRAKQGYAVVHFNKFLDSYLEKNGGSAYIRSILQDKLYEVEPAVAVTSNSAERIVDAYNNGDQRNKNKILDLISQDLDKVGGQRNWGSISSDKFNTANEILEKIVESISKSPGNDHEIAFIKYIRDDLPYVDYFSNIIDEFLAGAFVNNIAEIKSMTPKNLFVNTLNYIKRKLGESHPKVLQAKEFIAQDAANAGRDIEDFIEKLNLGKVTNSQLKLMFSRLQEDLPYISYVSEKTKDWFKTFVNAVINNITIKNFKVLGKSETYFLLAIIIGQDIILSRDEQISFTNKFGKSDYGSKNLIANYRHIDPDVFINLIGPDLKAGGMGPGLTFKGFEHTANVYRLLYNNKKVVDLFCDVARPGLMKMIVENLNDELIGHPNPQHTWGRSGFLIGSSVSYHYDTLPYIHDNREKIKISEAVNMDDIAWFEYFISKAKKAPKRGVAGAIATLEKNLNDKKSKMQATPPSQTNDDLDPQLDLSHRKIVGNTLKEVYNIVNKIKGCNK